MEALGAGTTLGIGDILRLPEDYDRGPGSGPVDLMVCELNEAGPALLVVSGRKCGLLFAVLPAEARGESHSLSADWLLANWREWFRFTYVDAPVQLDGAKVLRWSGRGLFQSL